MMKKILVCILAVSMFLFAWTSVSCKKGGNDSSSQTSIDSSQSADSSQDESNGSEDSSQDGDSSSSDSAFELGSNELPPIDIP